jgi:hypothetical protein
MSTRRGKKLNPAKNEASARDFAAGKRIVRKKQIWVWDVEPLVTASHPMQVTHPGQGHWETVNVSK